MNKGVKNDTLDFGSVAAGDEVDKLQRLYQDLIGSLLLGCECDPAAISYQHRL